MVEPTLVPKLSESRVDREARSYDFGRITRKVPQTVARPKSVEEVSSIVRWAGGKALPLAIRGGGHSQGGQSLTDSGVSLDTVWLGQVEREGQDLLVAQGGARWGAVVDTLRGTGRLPRVLTDIGEVTVGGTLAAGGFGTTSYRYGLQIAQVEQLEVVIGTGERVRCSPSQNSDLFDAVRGGQGQFGIITAAWIRLRATGTRIRRYELLYRDYDRFAIDFERVVDDGAVDRLRAETRVHDREIILDIGVEYDERHDDGRMLDGLGYDKVVRRRDTAAVGQEGIYPSWAFSRRLHHPWRDWFLPWTALRAVLAQTWLDPDWVPRPPRSWIGIYPIRTQRLDAPLFMHPAGDRMFSYSILAVSNTREEALELARRLRHIDRALIKLGGKSYLSGRVSYERHEWQQHYGDMLGFGSRWKAEFDPLHLFRNEEMPFGDSTPATGRRTGNDVLGHQLRSDIG